MFDMESDSIPQKSVSHAICALVLRTFGNITHFSANGIVQYCHNRQLVISCVSVPVFYGYMKCFQSKMLCA